jgi:hypothetical protein
MELDPAETQRREKYLTSELQQERSQTTERCFRSFLLGVVIAFIAYTSIDDVAPAHHGHGHGAPPVSIRNVIAYVIMGVAAVGTVARVGATLVGSSVTRQRRARQIREGERAEAQVRGKARAGLRGIPEWGYREWDYTLAVEAQAGRFETHLFGEDGLVSPEKTVMVCLDPRDPRQVCVAPRR